VRKINERIVTEEVLYYLLADMIDLIELTHLTVGHGPPLWSSGQSSWLQIQRSGFDSRRYQMF
jgi:hypothetical protein